MKQTCETNEPRGGQIPDIAGAFGSLDREERVALFSPAVPVIGENSSAHPAHLPPGYFQRLQNVRFHNSDLYVRDGSLQLAAAAPVAGASFRGAFVGVLDGSLRMFAAYRVTGSPDTTRVYEVGGISGTSYTFTEITQASGNPYDEMEATTNVGTRFYDDGFVTFAIVSDGLGPTPTDLLVFSNGVNAPRVHGSKRDMFGGITTKCATHGPVTRPVNDTCFSQPDVTSYVDVRTSASTTIGTVTGTAALTKETSGGDTYLQLVTGTGTGSGIVQLSGSNAAWNHDGDYFQASSSLKLNLGKQLILVVEDSKTNPIWRYCKITANAGGTPVVLWDPSQSTVYVQPYYYALSESKYIVAFDLEESKISAASLAAITDFKFEITTALSTTRTLKIFGIMHGGFAPAVSEYTVSYVDSKSRAESGGTVALRKDPPNLGGAGGRGCAIAEIPDRLPIADGLYLRHAISYADTGLSNRVDYALLYRREFEETTYLYAGVMGIPRTNTFGGVSIYSDNTRSRQRYINRVSPTGSTVTVPYAAYLMAGNGRLYAGRVKDAEGELWISGDRTPFRFSQVAKVTGAGASTNPAYHRFQGEIVQGVVILPGQTYSAAPSLVFTNRRTYRIEGVDALSLSRATVVSNIGCAFPRSIAEHNGQVYFVSSDRQVWRYGLGSDGTISYNVVDARLRAATLTNCSAIAGLYGYQLAIQESPDTTAKTVMRYDTVTEKWNNDYLGSAGVVGMIAFDNGAERRTVMFLSDGKVMWFEKPGETLDAGSPIALKLVSREIHTGLWQRMIFSEVGVIADIPATRPTLTVTKAGKVLGNSIVGEINFNSTTRSRMYREELKQGTTSDNSAIEDVSCVVTIEGNVLGGTHFHHIGLDVSVHEEAPDVYKP